MFGISLPDTKEKHTDPVVNDIKQYLIRNARQAKENWLFISSPKSRGKWRKIAANGDGGGHCVDAMVAAFKVMNAIWNILNQNTNCIRNHRLAKSIITIIEKNESPVKEFS